MVLKAVLPTLYPDPIHRILSEEAIDVAELVPRCP